MTLPLTPGDSVQIIGERNKKATFKGWRPTQPDCAVLTVPNGGFRFVKVDRIKKERKR